MSLLVKGILSFPTLFTPKIAKGATEPKFSTGVLIPAGDPQVSKIQQAFDNAVRETFTTGLPVGTDVCWMLYDDKYRTKEYYDPRFSGWWSLTSTRKEADGKPPVVDSDYNPIIDPALIYGGCVAHVHINISGYTKGRGGIGGWLNGVMYTGEIGQFGRLDGRPTVEQMFAGVDQQPMQQPVKQMTALANGVSYEQMIAAGWTDTTLIQHGYMLP